MPVSGYEVHGGPESACFEPDITAAVSEDTFEFRYGHGCEYFIVVEILVLYFPQDGGIIVGR
jgi:hypothetical protein